MTGRSVEGLAVLDGESDTFSRRACIAVRRCEQRPAVLVDDDRSVALTRTCEPEDVDSLLVGSLQAVGDDGGEVIVERPTA